MKLESPHVGVGDAAETVVARVGAFEDIVNAQLPVEVPGCFLGCVAVFVDVGEVRRDFVVVGRIDRRAARLETIIAVRGINE